MKILYLGTAGSDTESSGDFTQDRCVHSKKLFIFPTIKAIFILKINKRSIYNLPGTGSKINSGRDEIEREESDENESEHVELHDCFEKLSQI